jgi:Family of unknown function (DUF6454)
MIRKAIGSRLAAFTLLFSSLAVSASPTEMRDSVEHARLLGTLALNGELFHVQGVEVDTDHIWVTSADRDNHKGYIHEFDRATGQIVRRLELTDGPRFHPGGISMSGNSIWVPVAELKANSSAVLVEIDKDTLQIRRTIRVADHLGCVAASGNTLIAGNWDSRLFYIFDLTGAQPVRTVHSPTRTRYQDMKLVDGKLVAGGMLTGQSGTIDWIDPAHMRLLRTLRTGATISAGPLSPARSYTAEGMALKGRDLYLVPEDGPSRMFHFRLDESLAAM